MNTTDEFSFILKPTEHGVGVFAVHDIKKDTPLRLFGDNATFEERIRTLSKNQIPNNFLIYCIELDQEIYAPKDFGRMEIGWYLNHSKNANAYHIEYNWYASKDIKAEEEILIDYNSLGEPEEVKGEYYQN